MPSALYTDDEPAFGAAAAVAQPLVAAPAAGPAAPGMSPQDLDAYVQRINGIKEHLRALQAEWELLYKQGQGEEITDDDLRERKRGLLDSLQSANPIVGEIKEDANIQSNLRKMLSPGLAAPGESELSSALDGVRHNHHFWNTLTRIRSEVAAHTRRTKQLETLFETMQGTWQKFKNSMVPRDALALQLSNERKEEAQMAGRNLAYLAAVHSRWARRMDSLIERVKKPPNAQADVDKLKTEAEHMTDVDTMKNTIAKLLGIANEIGNDDDVRQAARNAADELAKTVAQFGNGTAAAGGGAGQQQNGTGQQQNGQGQQPAQQNAAAGGGAAAGAGQQQNGAGQAQNGQGQQPAQQNAAAGGGAAAGAGQAQNGQGQQNAAAAGAGQAQNGQGQQPAQQNAPPTVTPVNWEAIGNFATTIGTGVKEGAGLYIDAKRAQYAAHNEMAKTIGQTLTSLAGIARPPRTMATEIAAAAREIEQDRRRQEQIAAASRQIAGLAVPAGTAGLAVPAGTAGLAVPAGHIAGHAAPSGTAGHAAPSGTAGPPAPVWKPGAAVTSVRAAPTGALGGGGGVAIAVASGEVGGLANFAARDVPGGGALQYSAGGMLTRDDGGVLLPHQMNALRAVGDFLSGKPGRRPLRSMLVFHSMGSGKSAVAHAIVNLVVGAARGLGETPPSSLACRVALLWQSTSDAERQMAFLRANQFSVLGGTVARGAEIPGVITGSIDNSADHDALKNQLGLPTRSWLQTLQKATETRGAAAKELSAAEMKLRAKNIEISRIQVDLATYKNAGSGGMYRSQSMPKFSEQELTEGLARAKAEVAELTKRVQAGHGTVSEATAREQAAAATHACTEKNPTLVVVDESHKLLADGNLAYGILLACAVCGHARLVLMSGTPVTSAAPLSELVRLCMLLGGKQWVLAAIDRAVPSANRAALRSKVASVCEYGTLQAVLNRGHDATFEARVAAAESTLASIGSVLREVEEAVTAAIGHAKEQDEAIKATVRLAPLLISYYGRLNGNVVDHERYRDTFDEYDYSAILRKLRDTHVAAVSYATQIDEEHEDLNFEAFPDGGRYTRTVDDAHYDVAPDGAVAWRGLPVLRGPPTFVGTETRLWHSCREYVPAFVANRTVRVLHVSVPSYSLRREPRQVRDPKTREWTTRMVPVKLNKPSPLSPSDVPVIYGYDWISRNLITAAGWEATRDKATSFEALGQQWGACEFLWCLGVAFAAACASRHEGPEDERGPVAIYVDRKSYGLTAAQMELLVHAVFSAEAGMHPLHTACGRRGCPYQGRETPLKGALSYQIGWRSHVDLNARPLSAWYVGATAAPAAFGRDAPVLNELVSSFGPAFPLALDQVALAIQGKTTLFDDEIRLDIASTTMRGRELMHVYVKDLWVTEANGESVNPEGESLEHCVALYVIGMPPKMGAQKMEQLFDRINRVNVHKTAKRKKHIVHITSPRELAPDSTLGTLGTTALDAVVARITLELARTAVDCDTNREPHERSAMQCAARWRPDAESDRTARAGRR
jgi:hypothetical protein